jgi:Protein of unknown function (DUF3606)
MIEIGYHPVKNSHGDLIRTEEDAEIQYWTETFGVTRHQLLNAIILVGTAVTDVQKFLLSGTEPARH